MGTEISALITMAVMIFMRMLLMADRAGKAIIIYRIVFGMRANIAAN